MLSESGWIGKGLEAPFAFQRFVPRVGPLVDGQLIFIAEPLTADSALFPPSIGIIGSAVSAVDMPSQIPSLFEALSAKSAQMGPIVHSLDVDTQQADVPKLGAAPQTLGFGPMDIANVGVERAIALEVQQTAPAVVLALRLRAVIKGRDRHCGVRGAPIRVANGVASGYGMEGMGDVVE